MSTVKKRTVRPYVNKKKTSPRETTRRKLIRDAAKQSPGVKEAMDIFLASQPLQITLAQDAFVVGVASRTNPYAPGASMPSWNELLAEIQESARSNNGIPNFDQIRREYLRKLADHTGRDTILYSTCFANREAVPQSITSIVDEDMTGFMTAIHRLRNKNLDLILHSPGGSIEAAESIIEYLRGKFRNIRVIVPPVRVLGSDNYGMRRGCHRAGQAFFSWSH